MNGALAGVLGTRGANTFLCVGVLREQGSEVKHLIRDLGRSGVFLPGSRELSYPPPPPPPIGPHMILLLTELSYHYVIQCNAPVICIPGSPGAGE